MIYKEYGNTGKKISAVSFGGMRFDMEKSIEENAQLLHYAYEKGINLFDTAPGYCEDKSEAIFGAAFKTLRGNYYVATKAMPEYFDTAEKAYERVCRSLEIMNIDKINFYYIWCIRKMSQYELAMRSGGQYEGLLKAQEEGLIEHITLSSHQTGDELQQIINNEKISGILMGVNILNFPYRISGAEAAQVAGMGVIAMNPLAGGQIPQNEKAFDFLARPGETATEAALRFLIANPAITSALNGFTTREHIDTACKVADNATPFTTKELDMIRDRLSVQFNCICTACGYCKDCPADIPIPKFMQFYNDKLLFNKTPEEMSERLNFQYNWGLLADTNKRASDCIACGKCETACTQHLSIIERLNEIDQWHKNNQ
jgi:uncharacterized protein